MLLFGFGTGDPSPTELEESIEAGKRVIIPFGNYGKTEGIVYDVYSDPADYPDIKEIDEVIDNTPIITKTGFKLADFIRKKYLCTYYDALKLNMPSGLKTFVDEKIFLNNDEAANLS